MCVFYFLYCYSSLLHFSKPLQIRMSFNYKLHQWYAIYMSLNVGLIFSYLLFWLGVKSVDLFNLANTPCCSLHCFVSICFGNTTFVSACLHRVPLWITWHVVTSNGTWPQISSQVTGRCFTACKRVPHFKICLLHAASLQCCGQSMVTVPEYHATPPPPTSTSSGTVSLTTETFSSSQVKGHALFLRSPPSYSDLLISPNCTLIDPPATPLCRELWFLLLHRSDNSTVVERQEGTLQFGQGRYEAVVEGKEGGFRKRKVKGRSKSRDARGGRS